MTFARAIRDIRTIKKLLTGAETEAHQAGESVPGAEHLLLSALALPDGTARRAFERLGADPAELPAAIASQHAAALRAVGVQPDAATDEAGSAAALEAGVVVNPPRPTRVYHSTASADDAFRTAVNLAKTPKPVPLTGAHVVIAVAQLEHGTAPRALRGMNIDRHELAAAARDELVR